MDYRRYPALMDRYHELSAIPIEPQETREGLIKKLIDASLEKKQIWADTNTIIREHIETYEKEPSLMDSEAVAALNDFLALLSPKDDSGMTPLDPAISLRIARLLLQHYQPMGDPEQTISILRQCALFDLILKDHRNDYDTSPYALMAERYMAIFEDLSNQAVHTLVHCLTIGGYNMKDLTFGLQKFRENRETFDRIREKLGEDDATRQYYYALFKINALGYALLACNRTEEAKKQGTPLPKPLIDLNEYGALMEEFQQELTRILASREASSLIYDRVNVKLYLAQTDYHLGKITLPELLARIEEYSRPQEDYTPYEQSSALFMAIPRYLYYLCLYGNLDRQQLQDQSTQIIEELLAKASADETQRESAMSNRAVLQMLCTASGCLEFDFFKATVLNATVYANKELYVHTNMVKEICLVILDYILDHDPRYLDGIAGHSWEYCRDHRQQVMDLMENCALLHDIGKYFCLDIVNNSSRRLTDDEFEIIKEHPTNFSKIYQGEMSPELQCIRDCAELHHLWFNEQGGYPRRTHTNNKSFVNILTIADCIDAATDGVGRPYSPDKTLPQVIGEFDDRKGTQYSDYITELLHVEEIQHRIEHIIKARRRELYCDSYLHNS